MSPGVFAQHHDAMIHEYRSKPRYQQRDHARCYGTYTSYNDPEPLPKYDILTQRERSQQFAVRQATQSHLMSSNYTPSVSNFVGEKRAKRATALSRDHHRDGEEEKPIPQRYINEFDQMWHEDDEDNDADQYLADLTANASWRKHQPLRPMYRPTDMSYGAFPGPRRTGVIEHRPALRRENARLNAPRIPVPRRSDVREHRPALRRENARSDAPRVGEFSASAPNRPALVSRFSWDSEDLTKRTKSPTATLAQTGKSLLKLLTPKTERPSMDFSK
jgi:hypothetical protein